MRIVIILLTILLLTTTTAHAAPESQTRYIIECMMLTGCWFHPIGYSPDYWFWVPIYVDLEPHQYDRVWRMSDWRWIPDYER